MSKKLNEQLWAVAKEYARQFGEVLGADPEFWIADEPWLCCFGDCYYFTLEEMAVVVNNLDKYMKRYGSKEDVGQEIRDWVDWWLDSDIDVANYERVEARVTKQLRVNISLYGWLDGCPHEDRKPFEGPDADYLRHQTERDILNGLIREYRENRTLGNVLATVEKLLDIDHEEKAKRDFETWEKLIKIVKPEKKGGNK